MSSLVVQAIFNADFCEILGNVDYSTNPRDYVTIEDMQEEYKKFQTIRD